MVRTVAQKTYDALMMDSFAMLSPACYLDFGMDMCSNDEKTKRFGALQNAVREGATPRELDAALGDSGKLTALVQKYGSNVVFPKNSWEIMEEEMDYDV